MNTNEIRTRYLKFFEAKGHRRLPSDSLVPENDPTLLFTGAGMNQFKAQFMGEITDYTRATTSQKCLRTGDLENVGKTSSHHSFFEMLGNFSFGDYFKEEAIRWAWELLVGDFRIDPALLWISVYEQDEEAYRIWKEQIKVPQDRILKLGPKENFWPADAPDKGPNGPCGPCSEIFFDRGEAKGEERLVEIWNLVFTQFDRKDGGALDPLPNKNIDTGMGLERMAAVMQGVDTNFEIDLFAPIRQRILKLAGGAGLRELGPKVRDLNAIADHVRAAAFCISDGVIPGNEGRGYVIRKLIRKAAWHARMLGVEGLFQSEVAAAVV
ncbi:MAG: alanine--tRNA ligase, partial [Candidatus Omnitrophica bacterium]|nr:alanine--tRNA ligase [Candidatus Omnitrophota bacterium]